VKKRRKRNNDSQHTLICFFKHHFPFSLRLLSLSSAHPTDPQRLLFLCYPFLDFRIARTVASWPSTMPLNERLLIPHTHTDTVCTYVWWGTHKSREKRWWLTPGRRMNRSMTLNNSRIPFLAIQQSHPIKSGKKPTVSLYRRDTKEGRRASPPTFQAT
jgi:hypothetical protein